MKKNKVTIDVIWYSQITNRGRMYNMQIVDIYDWLQKFELNYDKNKYHGALPARRHGLCVTTWDLFILLNAYYAAVYIVDAL